MLPNKKKKVNLQKKAPRLSKKAKRNLEREERCILREDGIQRELAMQKTTMGVIEKFWTTIMKNQKIKSFHEDIQATRDSFEYVIDQKNRLIKELQKFSKEAEDQTLFNLSGFVETIDVLIKGFQDDTEEMNVSYEQNILSIKKRALHEKTILEESVEEAETRLGILMWAMRDCHTDTIIDVTGTGIAKHSEEDRELSLKCKKMQNSLSNLYSMRWDQYKTIFKKYHERTEEKRQALDYLKKKDAAIAAIINRQERMIEDNETLVKRLKKELKMQEDDTLAVEHLSDFKSKTRMIKEIKEQTANDADLDRKQFSELAFISEEIIKWLGDVVKKGESILTAKKLCDKLSTSNEIEKKYDTKQQAFNIMRRNYSTGIQTELTKWNDLQNLSIIIAKVNAMKKSLENEKVYLLKQNAELRQQVKDWMESLKLPAEEPKTENSGPPSFVIEASLQVKYYE